MSRRTQWNDAKLKCLGTPGRLLLLIESYRAISMKSNRSLSEAPWDVLRRFTQSEIRLTAQEFALDFTCIDERPSPSRHAGAMDRLGVSGTAAAAWLKTVEDATSRVPRPDLVWSGPEVPGLHARDTRRVYEELLGSAEHSVWASTFAFFDGPKAFEVLARRMDAKPKLSARLLLNIQRKWGDTTASEQLIRRFADRFWATEWPGASRPSVFYDPRALQVGGPTGVLHAKAVVVDDEAVFVTSANLTEAALDRNIELGLVVRDRALAASVSTHFRTLIEKALLLPLPAA
jgi:phosphatidylserine/phosphatidylglycerophosphate/cardiolipin synthase-like enzyme